MNPELDGALDATDIRCISAATTGENGKAEDRCHGDDAFGLFAFVFFHDLLLQSYLVGRLEGRKGLFVFILIRHHSTPPSMCLGAWPALVRAEFSRWPR